MVHLAFDTEANLHYVIRKVASDELNRPRAKVTAGQLNSLLMAKNPLALLESIDELGPFFIRDEDLEKHKYSPSMLRDTLREQKPRFTFPDTTKLLDECFFDPFSVESPEAMEPYGDAIKRRPTTAAKKAIERYGLSASFVNSIDAEEDCLYLIECLTDWLLLRNLVSVVCRLSASVAHVGEVESGYPQDSDNILRDCGFADCAENRPYWSWAINQRRPAFAIPVAYNTGFKPGSYLVNALKWDRDNIEPFYRRITEYRENGPEKLGLGGRTVVREDYLVFMLSAVEAGLSESSAVSERTLLPMRSRWTYLAVEKESDDETQLELATRLLNTIDKTFRSCSERSVAFYTDGDFDDLFFDAPQAVWDVALHHPGYRLMKCKQCGRTILTPLHTGGQKRTFCTDQCRIQFSKENASA